MPASRRSTGRGRSGSTSSSGHRDPSTTSQSRSQHPTRSSSTSSSRTGTQHDDHRTRGSRTSGAGNGRHQGRAMIESLEEGFLTELADMLDGENQLLKTLQKLGGAVESRELRDAFEHHLEQTHEHVSRIEQVFQMFGRKPETDRCEGLQGIVTEGDELLRKTAEGPLRDALIIAAAQKAEHYEMAAYGSLCAWADQLGETRALRLLEETLNEEKMADRTLTRIAESFANVQAPERRGDRDFGRGGGREFGGREGGREFGRSNEPDRYGRGGFDDRNRRDDESSRRFDEERQNRGFQGGMRGRGDWEPPYSDTGMGGRSRSRDPREKRYEE